MQVDPIKPTLKPPGTKRLKLKCDEPLSNVAFKFNLRRYNVVLNGLDNLEARKHVNRLCLAAEVPLVVPARY